MKGILTSVFMVSPTSTTSLYGHPLEHSPITLGTHASFRFQSSDSPTQQNSALTTSQQLHIQTIYKLNSDDFAQSTPASLGLAYKDLVLPKYTFFNFYLILLLRTSELDPSYPHVSLSSSPHWTL